jgi:hypothetical protein
VAFVSRAWEHGAPVDGLVRPQVVYQDLVADAAETLACTGEGGRFVAVIAAPENAPQIFVVGDEGPSAAHRVQIDQSDEPDPVGISAYQSAAFGLEAFRAHLTGEVAAPRLVDRDYPDSATTSNAFGTELKKPRPFQAGGLNATVLGWTIGAGAVGLILVTAIRPLRRVVPTAGVLLVVTVVGGVLGFGVAALRAVDPPTEPSAQPAPVADERLETIAEHLKSDGVHIDPLAAARMEPGFEEELRTSVETAPGPIRVAVLDATRVDLGGRYIGADAQTIAAHMDDGVFTLVLSQPGDHSQSANSLAIDDYLKRFEWDWTGEGLEELVHFYADPPLKDPGPGLSKTVENREPPEDIRRLDPATASGLDRVVLAGVPLGGALAGFGLGLGIVVVAGAVLVGVRVIARRRRPGSGVATAVILTVVAGSLVSGVLDTAPAVAAPEDEPARFLEKRIVDEGGIVVGEGAGDAHVPPVGQSVIDEVLAEYERDAVHDGRLYIAAYGEDVDAGVVSYELQEPGILIEMRSGLSTDRATDDVVGTSEVMGFDEDEDRRPARYLNAPDVPDLEAAVDAAGTATAVFRGNSAEVVLRLVAAQAADPSTPLPLEYVPLGANPYPVSSLRVDATDADVDAAHAAAALADEAADDVAGGD